MTIYAVCRSERDWSDYKFTPSDIKLYTDEASANKEYKRLIELHKYRSTIQSNDNLISVKEGDNYAIIVTKKWYDAFSINTINDFAEDTAETFFYLDGDRYAEITFDETFVLAMPKIFTSLDALKEYYIDKYLNINENEEFPIIIPSAGIRRIKLGKREEI